MGRFIGGLVGGVECRHCFGRAAAIRMGLEREGAVAVLNGVPRCVLRHAQDVPPLIFLAAGELLESTKRLRHHVAGAPAGDTAQGFNGFGDRPEVVPNGFPNITRKAVRFFLIGKIYGDATIVWRFRTGVRKSIVGRVLICRGDIYTTIVVPPKNN